MPKFFRQNNFTHFSQILLLYGGVCVCLFCCPPVYGQKAPVPALTSDIPVVSVPQNSGEIHGFLNGLNAKSAPKKTPYQDAITASSVNKGQIQLASGSTPQNPRQDSPKTLRQETVKPSDSPTLAFKGAPSQVPSAPLGSAPFRKETPPNQSTRPIRSSMAQQPKQLLPNRIKTARFEGTSDDSLVDAALQEPNVSTEQTFSATDESEFGDSSFDSALPDMETYSGQEYAETEPQSETSGFARRDPYAEIAQNPPSHYADFQSNELPETLGTQNSDPEEEGFLGKMLPEPKEKSGEKLAFMSSGSQLMPLLSALGSLCLVLGTFFVFVLLLKKVGPKNGGSLPKEALENVGRYALNPKLQLNLIRLGNRLILVAITPDGAVETISEIDSKDEVTQILGMCRKLDPNGSQTQFREVLHELEQEKTPGGFFGPNDPKRKTNAAPTLSSLLAGGLRESDQRSGGLYG